MSLLFNRDSKFRVGDILRPILNLQDGFVVRVVKIRNDSQQYEVKTSDGSFIYPSFDFLHSNYEKYVPNYNKIWNNLNG